MLYMSDLLKKNHSGTDVYTHVIETSDKTKSGKYIWYRLIVYNKQNTEIGNYKGLKLISKAGNTYYKFIDKNLLTLRDIKKSLDLLTHVETINDLIEQENGFA